jgi:transketolase C-terminal domain/subunit
VSTVVAAGLEGLVSEVAFVRMEVSDYNIQYLGQLYIMQEVEEVLIIALMVVVLVVLQLAMEV